MERSVQAVVQQALDAHRAGRLQEAEALYRRALAADAGLADVWRLLGLALYGAGRLEEAADTLQQALEVQPGHARAWFDLGNLQGDRGRPAEAVHALARAGELDPDFADAHFNRGLLLAGAGDLALAEAALRDAVAADPAHARAWTDLGSVLGERGNDAEAEACYRRALDADPDQAGAWYGLGNLLNRQLRLGEAIAAYRDALARAPGDRDALAQLFHLLQRTCAWDEMETLAPLLDRQTEAALAAGERPGETPFMDITRHMDPERNFRVARAWSAEVAARFPPGGFPVRRRRRDRIRLGYVSGNFFDHATAHNTLGVLRGHDRGRFEVHAFAYGRNDGSVWRRRVEEACDSVTDIAALPPAAAAEEIHAAGVDILVGLMGHTTGSRLEIAALRPAPVQATWLTFPGTSGADFFDYVLVDGIVAPPAEHRFYSEAPVTLPDAYWPTDDRLAIDPETPGRAEAGLPAQGVVFCSFNHSQKIEPVMFDTWMEILRAVEGSVLWLLRSNDPAVAALRAEAEARGVAGDRLVFADHWPKERHLARLRLADLVLDTRIYTGHTTNSDALWAGVPVLTVPGGHFASRVSASMLRSMGLDDLICPDLEAFRDLAVALARDPERLAALRVRVAEARRTAPLFDTARLVGHLETAFARMYEAWLAGTPPAPIDLQE